MGPWILQSVTLLSAGQQNLLRCLPAWIFLRFNSHNPHRLRYACYFLQSHAEVPKLALEELIEVLKPLNLKNRDLFDDGVSLQHRFITNYLFKASLDISIQHCVLHWTHTSGSHGNVHIFNIQFCTERLREFYCFTPKINHVQDASESETEKVQGKNTSEKV